MDGWSALQIDSNHQALGPATAGREIETETEREGERQTDRQTEIETETERETERDREREREMFYFVNLH